LTAETGAAILAAGGNAVDACIAAGFTSWVAESPLTGPGAGGFMLVHRARDGLSRLLDFFVAVPGLGHKRQRHGEMETIDPDLARTLELLAERCAGVLHGGKLGRELTRFVREHGGEITPQDLASYRVIWRRPTRAPFFGHEFVSNPPPSSGGVLIGYGLRLL